MDVRNHSSGAESDSDNSMNTEDNDKKDSEIGESANEDNDSVNESESDDRYKSGSSSSDGEQEESDIENIKPAALSGGERLTSSHRSRETSTSSSQEESSDFEPSEGEPLVASSQNTKVIY